MIIHREEKSKDDFEEILELIEIKNMEDQRLFLVNLSKQLFCIDFYLFYSWLIKRINVE